MTVTVTESKLKGGTLTLDATEFATQATNVVLEPSVDEDGDPAEVLSGDVLTADSVTTWQLTIKAIQDFSNAAGLQRFSWDRDGEVVPYSWSPTDPAAGPTYTGNVEVRALAVGGDVNKRLDVDAEWPCTGKPTWNDPPAA